MPYLSLSVPAFGCCRLWLVYNEKRSRWHGERHGYTAEASKNGGFLRVLAEDVPLFFFGTETEPPPNSGQTFLANWWFTGPEGRMKQSTLFPVISFGTAAVFLYTSNVSLLGKLIDGNADGDFSILSVRGVYPAATMTVSLNRQH